MCRQRLQPSCGQLGQWQDPSHTVTLLLQQLADGGRPFSPPRHVVGVGGHSSWRGRDPSGLGGPVLSDPCGDGVPLATSCRHDPGALAGLWPHLGDTEGVR